MKKITTLGVLISFTLLSFGQFKPDSIWIRKAKYDKNGELLSWYKPNVPGAAYDKVINLASDFIKRCPVEPTSNLPLYMVHCWYWSPRDISQEDFDKGLGGSDDGHTPACTYANFVQSFVLKHYPYTGDDSYIELVGKCLDQLIDHGTTPDDSTWAWAGCPYASANPRSPEYFGATHWGVGGRNDGPFVIEPDKVGEVGIQYLNFYKVTENEKYLNAAIKCADALAKNCRDVYGKQNWDYIYEDHPIKSPWPFRVSAENGQVHEQYTAHVVPAINLFHELIRLQDRLDISDEKIEKYKETKKYVWEWVYSPEGPMRTFIWKGYFEDIPNDKYNKNRVQNIPLETARFILEHPEYDDNIEVHIPALIYYVATAFETHNANAIKEQFWCYEPMGSHTARYASLCAMWYEHTGNKWFKDQATKFFNWATYVCDDEGMVIVGPKFNQYWFSDGYGDYIRHFYDGMAAIPEWAPADENHLLKSSSVVTDIKYSDKSIEYSIYDDEGEQIFRLTGKPSKITIDGKELKENEYQWEELGKGGVLRLSSDKGKKRVIQF